MLLTTTCILAYSQLPPVTFPSATNVCDYTPWKLVFYDGFDGTSVKSSNWYTFNTNNGGTNDNWCEARVGYPGNESIHRDENVVVSGGTVKLKVKQKSNTWQCASCDVSECSPGFGNTPVTKNYTTGYISSTTTYNNGRIEARLKMPLFKYSWATCWTWFLSGVNEIDFAESTGGSTGHSWPYIGHRPNNTYNLHAWAPSYNPYGLPNPASISNSFPNQSWWEFFKGKQHKQDEWHTYLCEWDTASIKTYLDGVHLTTIWKYYKKQIIPYYDGTYWTYGVAKISSGCTPSTGTW